MMCDACGIKTTVRVSTRTCACFVSCVVKNVWFLRKVAKKKEASAHLDQLVFVVILGEPLPSAEGPVGPQTLQLLLQIESGISGDDLPGFSGDGGAVKKHPDEKHGVVPGVPSAGDRVDPSGRLEQRIAEERKKETQPVSRMHASVVCEM
jgi:hypothetical protein